MNQIWYKVCKKKKVTSGKLVLLFRSSEDGWDRKKFLLNAKNYDDTLILIKTNFGRIIGAYSPEKWQNVKN